MNNWSKKSISYITQFVAMNQTIIHKIDKVAHSNLEKINFVGFLNKKLV